MGLLFLGGIFSGSVKVSAQESPTARAVAIQELLKGKPWLRYIESSDKFFGLHHAGHTWASAEQRARTIHDLNGIQGKGRLATIRSAEENAVAASLARAYYRNVLLGGTDKDREGVWRWYENGQPGDVFRGAGAPTGAYQNFNRGEPNNVGGEHFPMLLWSSGGWNDVNSRTSTGYLVEWDGVDIVGPIAEEEVPAPKALNTVKVPLPDDLDSFVKDRSKAIQLGKALFWDMQVGSDGRTACATCHAPAGVDHRLVNTLNPGAPGSAFGPQLPGQAELAAQAIDRFRGANATVNAADFPFHKVDDPLGDKDNVRVLRSLMEKLGSQGVVKKDFVSINEGSPIDDGRLVHDPVFNVDGANARQVTGRNSPTTINSVFFDRLFWDGRANHYFNGVNEFGDLDPNARVLKSVTKTETTTTWGLKWVSWWGWGWWTWGPTTTTTTNEVLEPTRILLNNGALASQAVGPPNSGVEMAWHGRNFKDIARKLLALQPLALQKVHPDDSVLGSIASSNRGLNGVTYASLIRDAFRDEWWNSSKSTNDGHTMMEANFSLYWGLAVMMYESTLVSDDAHYDRWANGDQSALSDSAKRGLKIFLNEGKCISCHGGPEFAGATISDIRNGDTIKLVEKMIMGDGKEAWYDNGFYNIGVRPTLEDIAVGATHPEFGPLSYSKQVQNGRNIGQNDASISPSDRITVLGAFKSPTLRNVELTGPYFHNGGAKSLEETVEFYARGADFFHQNIADLDPDVEGISELQGNPAGVTDLVNFMKSLTDERVRWQKAPFDHPELIIPNGHSGTSNGVATDNLLRLPEVGRNGGIEVKSFVEVLNQ
jgi:cytochrome c peroxidase